LLDPCTQQRSAIDVAVSLICDISSVAATRWNNVGGTARGRHRCFEISGSSSMHTRLVGWLSKV